VELVAAPDGGRRLRHELEHAPGDGRVAAQPARALDRLADVGDRAAAPAPDLVAEQPKTPERAKADGPAGDDATLAVLGAAELDLTAASEPVTAEDA
jgi:hypothetical protein